MQWITLALGIVSGLGIGSWVSGRWERSFAAGEAEKAREHASAEARSARRFQIRFEAYKAASHYLSRHEQWVMFTEPMQGPLPDPPDLSPDEQWVEFGGVIAVTASDAVRDSMRAAADAEMSFDSAVRQYRRFLNGGDVESSNPGADMHKARLAALEAIQAAQTDMRDELADL